MKTFARIACVVVLAALTLVWTASSAQAKGPTEVDVSGPGIDDVHLTFTGRADVDAGTLGDAARLYDMWSPGQLETAPDLSADELGPRYVLTWSSDPHGAGSEDIVVQHAYPFAEGGGWVEFLPDQELYGAPITSGWVYASRLKAEMVALGAVAETAQPAVAQQEPSAAASDAPAASAEDDSSSAYGVAALAGVGLAVAVVAGLLIVRQRRLSR